MTTEHKHEIYVASSWRNEYQQDIVALLRAEGHEVYDFKNPAPGNDGFHCWSEIDEGWVNWTPRAFRFGLSHSRAEESFNLDMEALNKAEIVVLLLPSGRSSHVEAAYHKGKGGPVIVHMPERCEPELMYKMFNALTVDDRELVNTLRRGVPQLERAMI